MDRLSVPLSLSFLDEASLVSHGTPVSRRCCTFEEDERPPGSNILQRDDFQDYTLLTSENDDQRERERERRRFIFVFILHMLFEADLEKEIFSSRIGPIVD